MATIAWSPRSGGSLDTLHGNTAGLGQAENRALRALYRRSVRPDEFVSPGLAREVCGLSRQLSRRLGLILDRQGRVQHVVVGDAHRVYLPDLGARRAGAGRLRGVRLLLTTLRPDGVTEEDLTDLVLLQLDAVLVVQAMPDGEPGPIHVAHLLPPDSEQPWRIDRHRDVHTWTDSFRAFIDDVEGQFTRSPRLRQLEEREAAIVLGVTLGNPRKARRGLDELERLAETAGFRVVDRVLQNRSQVDGRTVIGSGKLEEIVLHAMHLGATTLLFDRELSPSQLRNVAESTELKVLDRTQLILDIFAQHASTREGKLQVELAQLRYRAPRLALMPTAMSRLTGGIGGRGPGETKLEINRRRAGERQTRLERELEELRRQRATRRKQRGRAGLPVVSLVGYTNAGKSTLLNRMTRSEVLAEDKLFATLDPTSRRMRFPEDREIIVTDTVGFIEDLPKTLIEAFRSTLEELEDADLLIHVLDAADEEVEAHLAAVESVIDQLGLTETPMLRVWNKAEVADPDALRRLLDRHGGLAVSALAGEGLERLLGEIERQVFLERAARRGPSDTDDTDA